MKTYVLTPEQEKEAMDMFYKNPLWCNQRAAAAHAVRRELREVFFGNRTELSAATKASFKAYNLSLEEIYHVEG